MSYISIVVLGLSAVVAGMAVTQAQEMSPLTHMMELNRSGKWESAAQLAQRFLDDNPKKSNDERCEAYYHLAYAQTRLGRTEKAHASLMNYEQKCKDIAKSHWVSLEVARLREELAPRNISPPVRDDRFWRTSEPATLGVNISALESHRRLCERTGADACLVIRRGKIVQEVYSARYRVPMYAMSSTKSITGLLVGMLIDDGKIQSVNEPVCAYIPEWCAGRRGKVTLRHLLTMTSGLPRMFDEGVASTNDKNRFVTGLSPSREPGTAWAYSNEGVQLLSPILDQAAGEPIQDYALKRLFRPLGMSDTRLHLDEKGHAWTYADMETTPRDLARIGLLMLNKGVWQGSRIVSASWIEQSIKRSLKFERGYGLLWWLYDRPKGYAALGHLNTNLYVFPEQELIVVRMQSKPLDQQAPYEPEALRLFEQLTRPVSPQSCLKYDAQVSLTGTLYSKVFPGPPNYESIRKGDRRETAWLLTLPKPICTVAGDPPDINEPESIVAELQLLISNPAHWKTVRRLARTGVTVQGTLFHAHTGHHRRKVLMNVAKIKAGA